MTFDQTISSEISLSKILDAFIIDNESSNVILSFIKQHDDAFEDILNYSHYCDRIFQLDFFLSCNLANQEYLLNKLKNTSLINAAFLTWQILRSNSNDVQHIKHKLRNEIKWILDCDLKHPYSKGYETYIYPVDNACFKLAEKNKIATLPFLVSNEQLVKYFKYFSYSLFQNRLMQFDFFLNLDDMSKFIFIKETFKVMKAHLIKNFALQLLDSDISNEVKKEVINSMHLYPTDILDAKTIELIQNCKSFSEMMLKMTLFNNDVTQHIVLYLALFKKKWLYDWYEYDKANLDLNLNISSFIEEKM